MAGSSSFIVITLAVALLSALAVTGDARTAAAGARVEDDAALFRSRATDPNIQVKFDFTPFLIQYRSGRVQRLMGTSVVPATSLDARTGVSSRDVVVDQSTGLAVRLYRPSQSASASHRPHGKNNKRLPVLLYFHGGAFVTESAFGPVYHAYLNALTARAGVVAVSVNYRLAPEHSLPAAYDDAWAALQWVLGKSDPWLARHADTSRLFLAGDSAGGNIAHNLAMRVGNQQQQKRKHPVLHGGLDTGVSGGGARTTPINIKGVALLDPYFLGRNVDETAARAWGFICAGKYGTDHPYVNPTAGLPAPAWRRLPTTRVLVTVSGRDGLGPWQRAYVDAVRGSGWGGQARMYVTPGEGHCFFLNDIEAPKAAMHMATLVAFVNGSTS